jgi:hypothetical protein
MAWGVSGSQGHDRKTVITPARMPEWSSRSSLASQDGFAYSYSRAEMIVHRNRWITESHAISFLSTRFSPLLRSQILLPGSP